MEYLLSIIVPIKDNYKYIKPIIEKSMAMNGELELVIQDNTEDNTEIMEYLGLVNAPFIKYHHCLTSLSMSENFNLGISNSTGQYICILGADDNVSSKILNVTKYLEKEQYDSAIFNKASYKWPGMKYRAHHKRPDLTIPRCSGEIHSVNVGQELNNLLKCGMTSLGELPEPYHGIVKREALEKVFKITGTFVPGACPDMAMAVALSQVVKKHIYIDAPITMSGHSYNSNGGKGARGDHKGKLEDIKFLPANVEENWPNYIPKIWTGPTIYADSMNSALIAMGSSEKILEFNSAANYADLVSFYPQYSNLIKKFINKNLKMKIEVLLYCGKIFFKRSSYYINNWKTANFHFTRDEIYYNVKTSLEASELVDKYIDKHFSNKDYLK